MSEPADSRPSGHPETAAGGDRVCGGGRLRLRPWQRLRGQRAFQRARGIGVYRHSAAALIRIMPLWELEALDLADDTAPHAGGGIEPTAGSESGRPRLESANCGSSRRRGSAKRLSITAVRGLVGGSEPAAGNQLTGAGSVIDAGSIPEGGSVKVGAPLRRLGIVASRKVGNAVVRNRAKRWFRELFRHNQHDLLAHCDVLVIVRNGFRDASYAELEAQFADVIRRARREAQRAQQRG